MYQMALTLRQRRSCCQLLISSTVDAHNTRRQLDGRLLSSTKTAGGIFQNVVETGSRQKEKNTHKQPKLGLADIRKRYLDYVKFGGEEIMVSKCEFSFTKNDLL